MATAGEKELKTDWPVVEGTTFETTKTHEKELQLQAEESMVLDREKAGIR